MFNKISSYIPFSKAVIKQEYFAYKYKFFIWVISNTISLALQLFLWIAIFRSSSTNIIKGYKLNEMLYYIILSKIVESFTYVSLESKVSEDFRSGNIAFNLCKPIKYDYELFFRAVGSSIGSTIMFAPMYILVLVIINLNFGSFNFNILNVIFFLLSIFLSFILNYLFSVIFSLFIFKTVFYSGVNEFKKILIKILSGAFFPIEFYPDFYLKIIKYLPFGYMRYYPIGIIQGKYSPLECVSILIICFVWIIILYIISRILWKKVYGKITVYGG